MKRSASDGSSEPSKRPKTQQQVADPNWTLEKQHADAIINFLVRLACQVGDKVERGGVMCVGGGVIRLRGKG